MTTVVETRARRRHEDFVTRILCAYSYVDPAEAEATYHELCRNRLVAIGPCPGVDLVALARHARQARLRHRGGLLVLVSCSALLLLCPVGLVLAAAAGSPGLLLIVLVVALLCAVAGWTVLVESRARGRRMARRLLDPIRDPRHARALRGERERLLADTGSDEANLIVYARDAPGEPFVGLGTRVPSPRNWVPIDVTQPSRTRGMETDRRAFTTGELVEWLADRFPRTGLDHVAVREVLYVAGDLARHIPELHVPDTDVPSPVLPEALLRVVARSGRDGVRSYLRVQVIGPGARVVLSLNVRPVLTGGQLTYDVVAHILPPPDQQHLAVRDVSISAFRRTVTPFLVGPRTVVAAARQAPRQLWREEVRHFQEAHRARQAVRTIRKGHAVDIGAFSTVRQDVAGREMSDSEFADVFDWWTRLTRALLDGTEKFLIEHNISTADLRRSRDAIVNNVYNIKDVRNSVLGDNNTQVNVQTPPDAKPASQKET